MKTLYLECGMGAAGDMLTAALYELLPQKEEFLKTMNGLGLPGVRVEAVPTQTCGVSGTRMQVTVDGREEGRDHGHGHDSHDHDHEDHHHGHACEAAGQPPHCHDHEHEHEHDHDHCHHDHDQEQDHDQ